MSRFYFGGSSNSSTSNDDDDDTLPYPTPLQRSDFLAPNFSPSTYLSTLHNRHQTLEDLRAELRARSQSLGKELLDLVNSNYQDFLGLGRSLKSGDEKVEEVRVGLLGFRKEVEGVTAKVAERELDVKKLVEERIEIRKEIAVGRALIEYDARLAQLEGLLRVDTADKIATIHGFDELSESDEDSDDENSSAYSMSNTRLKKHVQQYRLIQEIVKAIEESHPFITTQAPRMAKIRNTLLLDLRTALQQAKAAGTPGANRVMKVMKLYADMNETAEAVQVLKSLKAS